MIDCGHILASDLPQASLDLDRFVVGAAAVKIRMIAALGSASLFEELYSEHRLLSSGKDEILMIYFFHITFQLRGLQVMNVHDRNLNITDYFLQLWLEVLFSVIG